MSIFGSKKKNNNDGGTLAVIALFPAIQTY
jgi:hypothetical protein